MFHIIGFNNNIHVVKSLVKRDQYWKNPEYYRRKTLEWYARMKLENPQALKDYSHNYYERNKERARVWARGYRKKNKVIIAFKKNQYQKANRVKAISVLGEKCVWCGFDGDVRALQIDKISGGHRKMLTEKKMTDHQKNIWIIKHPVEAKKDWQVLCANCNTIKLTTNNERPRKHNYVGIM